MSKRLDARIPDNCNMSDFF